MAFYRHKPRLSMGQKISATGAVAVLLLLPMVINVLLPQVYSERTPVMLGGSGWEMPLVDRSQQQMECVQVSEIDTSRQWDCSDFFIETAIIENGESPTLTLRRAYRAFSPANVYPEGAEIQTDGRFSSLSFEGNSALTLTGDGENEGESIFVFFIAANHEEIVELVKESLK